MKDNDMPDPIGQSVQQAILAVLAPDVKELKDAVSAFGNRIDRLESHLTQQSEEHFQAFMKAIGGS